MPELVKLSEVIPGIMVELRYATARNFTGQPLYPDAEARLIPATAAKLAAVQCGLKRLRLGLKVWDAFRPRRAQQRMWDVLPDARFVAPPERGSRHNRGAAVDVTLVRLLDGAELPMGTDFDDFTGRAALEFDDLPPEVVANRRLLRNAMEQGGFSGIRSEWWHFDDQDWQEWPLLGEGWAVA